MTTSTCFATSPCLAAPLIRPVTAWSTCPARLRVKATAHRAPPLTSTSKPLACASAPYQQQEQQQGQLHQPPGDPTSSPPPPPSPPNKEDEDADQQVDSTLDSTVTSSTAPPQTPESESDRRVRLAKARLEAERLELLAAQAALASERAQLVADRKRLELDSLKAKRDSALAPKAGPSPSSQTVDGTGNVQPAPPTTATPPTTPNPVNTSKAEDTTSAPSKRPLDPSAKPPSPLSGQMLSELLGVDFPRLSESDINVLKDKVCNLKTFYVTHVDRSPFDERVVFRGNLRVDSSVAIDELEESLRREGLQDRVRLFLLMDPKQINEEQGQEKPVVVALPASALPNQTTVPATILSVIAAFATIFTALSYGVAIFGLNPLFLNKIATESLETLQALYTLPISIGALAIVLAHEVAHRAAAAANNIKLGLPVFLPSLQLGTYGTITPLQSYPRNRTRLFDVAVAGPLVGTAVSLAALIAGLFLTSTGDVADWFPQVPSVLFNGSLLVGALGTLILPPGLREQATIAVHPLLVVGYTGLLVNALNLIPIGRLDGGRLVQALYGRSTAGRISGITLVLQGFATIIGNSSLLLFWSLVCIFLQREGEYPCQDEVTEPNNQRFAVGIGLLLLMLLVLTPVPEQFSKMWA